jgi:lipopolysaccharide assembly outer membrane protein LptD (OstA)
MARAQQRPPDWEIHALSEAGNLEYDFQTGLTTGTNGVLVKSSSAVLTAERVTVNHETGEAIADGKVRIQYEDQIWVGEHIRYNFKTRLMEAEQFRTGKSPLFIEGQGLHAEVTNRVYAATNAFITTDDVSKPAIKVRAHYIKIIPGEKIEAHSATLYLAGVPVFYFPFYSRTLGPRANHFLFLPGYRSQYGAFLLTSYTWFLSEQLDGTAHVDYRTRRGVGTGLDLNYHLDRWGDGTIKYYYAHDDDPQAGVNPLAPVLVPDNRQLLNFSYQANPATNLNVKARVRYQSDSQLLRDFFEGEYRQNPQPSTFVELNKFWQNFSLDTYVQPRVDDFLETVERLPDVRLTGYRQEIGVTPLYYESESSAGYYRRLFAETNGPTLPDFRAARADTFHQVVLPETLFGWLNVTPRVGGRFTYYSRATGPGATTDEVYRSVFNTGAEVSFKASRVWPAIQSRFFDADGLRHIIEPSVNYVYVPSPAYHGTNNLPQFDYELPSLRLLPIEYPDYNAIDSIDSQNVLRWGLRNKLQTKRLGKVEDLLSWDLYTDWRLDPNKGQTTFADVYSDLVAHPRSWISFESQTRFDIDNRDWRMAFNSLTLKPNDVWSWNIGHFYLRDDLRPVPTALGVGNNLILSTLYCRLNENWGLRATHHFEARTGRMEEQDYSVYRDLRSWTAALTFRVRDNPGQSDDFTVAFSFSLKARPRYGLGSDVVKPYSLLGG